MVVGVPSTWSKGEISLASDMRLFFLSPRSTARECNREFVSCNPSALLNGFLLLPVNRADAALGGNSVDERRGAEIEDEYDADVLESSESSEVS